MRKRKKAAKITPINLERGFQKDREKLEQWLNEKAEENRKHPTEAELTFGDVLRRNHIDYVFQKPVIVKQKYGNVVGYSGYIVDYVVGRVAYEIDGGYHREHNQMLLDKIKTADLRKAGYKVIRLTNHQVKAYKL